MLRFALFISLSVTATAAPILKAKVKDADAIQGRWKPVEVLRNGKPVNKDFEGAVATIGKDAFTVKDSKGRSDDAMTYKLDGDKKHIDFLREAADANESMKGLYELDGDTLRIAFTTDAESVRPKELKAGPGVVFFKLQRVMEAKK